MTRTALLLAVAALVVACATAWAAATVTRDVRYSTAPTPLKRLDVHVPATPGRALRPVVMLVHGGAWVAGDKRSFEREKVRALTDAGFVVVNVDYRLSPRSLRPGRLRHPAHAVDVAAAVGWVHRRIRPYGGDPGRIALLGHSAGAHLVSLLGTDRGFLRRAGVPAASLRAVVSLDTDVYDIPRQMRTAGGRLLLQYQIPFGTAAEERRDPRWRAASPQTHADAGDAPQLVVTQSESAERRAGAERFAVALGQRPSDVLAVPYNHSDISHRLGEDDPAGETAAVLSFLRCELQVK